MSLLFSAHSHRDAASSFRARSCVVEPEEESEGSSTWNQEFFPSLRMRCAAGEDEKKEVANCKDLWAQLDV
jgi:hypothetical protein